MKNKEIFAIAVTIVGLGVCYVLFIIIAGGLGLASGIVRPSIMVSEQIYTPILVEAKQREVLNYLRTNHYNCSIEADSSNKYFESYNCSIFVKERSFTIVMMFERISTKLVETFVVIQLPAELSEEEVVIRIFTDMINLPIAGSDPIEVNKWMLQCIDMANGEIFAANRTINDVTYSVSRFGSTYNFRIRPAH